jgi:hypothetical protein
LEGTAVSSGAPAAEAVPFVEQFFS